jgi:hypothetical protein
VGILDPFVRRRIAALLLLAVAVVVVLALLDVGPFSNPPTEADRAQAALEDFFAAARDKDYQRVCELLSQAQQKTLEQAAAQLSNGKVGHGCAAAVGAGGGGALAHSELRIRDVRVSGSLAAIDASLRIEGVKGPQFRTFQLEEVHGEWRVSDLGI